MRFSGHEPCEDMQHEPSVSILPTYTPPYVGASSSRELSAYSRVLRPATCLPVRRPESASLGVHVPHRGISRQRPPFRRESRPRGQVPSSTFLTSSTVCSASSLCGFVSPRCHVQGLPFRGLSLTAEPY